MAQLALQNCITSGFRDDPDSQAAFQRLNDLNRQTAGGDPFRDATSLARYTALLFFSATYGPVVSYNDTARE